jgi:deoxyribonuclease V
VQYGPVETWPTSVEALVAEQLRLGRTTPRLWAPGAEPRVAGCFVCFPRGKSGGGSPGDRGWAAAAASGDAAVVTGAAGASYAPGLLALREGLLLETAVRGLPAQPEVVLADATGRDHPRHAGLALHLGAVLGLPTVGVTHRPLAATGEWPADEPAARTPLVLDGEVVGFWVRTRAGTRPLAVHAAWRTAPEIAVEVVLACTGETRTPEPLRAARTLARTARASEGRGTAERSSSTGRASVPRGSEKEERDGAGS